MNIIVSDAAADAGGRQFGYFEFALAGVPLLVGTVLVIVLLGRRLLPERTPAALPPDLGDLTDALRAQYALPEGELVGTRRGVSEVRRGTAVAAHRPAPLPRHGHPERRPRRARRAPGRRPPRGPRETLRAGDTLLLGGTWDKLQEHTSGGGEVLVVDDPTRLRRGVPLGRGAGGRSSSSS